MDGPRVMAEGTLGGSSPAAILEAEVPPGAGERLLGIEAGAPGTFALQGAALPLGRVPIEIDHEYRDSFAASSVRDASFRIVLPPRARIRFGLAVLPGGAPTAGVRFRVRARGEGGESDVFSEVVASTGAGHWLDRQADLSRWAGQEITLSLEATPEGDAAPPPISLWGSPVVEPAPGSATEAAGALPDILLVSVDTLRGDRIGRRDGDLEVTPVLNALAREGARFTRCRTQAPSTLYGHAAILTGLPPSAHGATTSSALPAGIPYLPDLLARAGYATAAITDDGLLDGRFGLSRGFDSFRNRYETVEEKVAAAQKALESLPHPWFLFLHTYQVHVPYEPPPDLARAFTEGDGSAFGLTLDARTMIRINNGVVPVTAADVRHVERLYDAQVHRTDAALGRLFDGMRAEGMWNGTVVAVTADHGEEFDEHGVIGWHSLHCYDEVGTVPLVVKRARDGPGAGRSVGSAVRSIDIAPTLLDLAGLASPETMWGRPLTGLLEGKREPDRETLCEIEDGRGAALLLGGYKIHVRTAESAEDPRTFRRRVSLRGRYGTAELYDLAADPGEQHDLSGSDPDRLRALREVLDARLEAARALLGALTGGKTPPPRPREDDEHLRRLRALGYVD